MIDHIKYFAKISSVAFLSFLKIVVLGFLSTILSFIVGLVILLLGGFHGGAPHGDGTGALLIIFLEAPVQWILLFLILASCVLIVSFAGSYALRKVINRIIQDKSESVLYPALDRVLLKLNADQGSLLKRGMDYSVLKLKLIDTVKKETDNKWTRRVLTYGFQKLKIDDIDFSQETIDTNGIIKSKTIQALKSVSAPGKTLFWCIIGFHWLAVLVIALMG
jgi:hypothetical protein